MDTTRTTPGGASTPGHYEVRFRGELDERRVSWFDGLTLHRHGDGTTVATGLFADQAAIHGVLERLRDLGLQLISVTPIPAPPNSDPASPTDTRGRNS